MHDTTTDPASVGMSASRLARIKPAMQAYVDHKGFAGISTMLARRGQIVHFEQVGWQDREGQTPLAPDTIYRIYSMTKPIICTALMILHEEGRFQLFDPVSKFLPAFGKVRVFAGTTASDAKTEELVRPMTIQHLFTHMAGLTYNFLEDSPVGAMYLESGLMSDSSHTLETIIAELARLPLAYQPGSHWHYSMSIDVLAHLIEVISGQPLQDFLQERFFKPLGMKDTAFAVPEDQQHRLSAMYGHPDVATHNFSQFVAAWQAGQNQRRNVDRTYPASGAPNFARGGHGLFSTAADYMRFAQMLLNGGQLDGVRILGRKTVELMHTNHVPAHLLPYQIGPAGPASGYGFGLGSRVLQNVAESAVTGSVGEYGWAGAAKTYFWVDPQEALIGVFMSQYMISFDLPDKDFQVLAYQAMVD
jgi:CubicO group peptidase (beta-lactamase class C family)